MKQISVFLKMEEPRETFAEESEVIKTSAEGYRKSERRPPSPSENGIRTISTFCWAINSMQYFLAHVKGLMHPTEGLMNFLLCDYRLNCK